MMHLHQDNSEQKKLIKWNVSYIIQENWAHRSHSEDEKKIRLLIYTYMSKEMKRVWHINMQKKHRKSDDLKSFQSCLKVLYTPPPPLTHIMPLFPFLQQVAEGNKKWSKVFITTYPVFQFSIGCTLITDSITFGSTSVIVLVAAWDSTRVFVLLSYNTQSHQSYFPWNSFMLMTQVFSHQKFTLLPSCMIN